jgi:tetratricopeptide (TPR) repeat protein
VLFEEALTLDPANTSFRLAYAAFLFDHEQWAIARQSLLQAVEENPELAQQWLESELQDTPGKTSLLYCQALTLAELHEVEAARAVLDELLNLDPNHGPAFADRATLLEAMGEQDLADQDYRSALSIEPQNVSWLVSHALLLESKARYEESLELLQRALSLDPENTTCYQQAQRLIQLAERETGARKHAALAQWTLASGAGDTEAAAHAEEALRLDERCAPAHSVQAEVLVRRRFLMQARQHLQRAVALEPGDQEYREALEALEASIEGCRKKVSGLIAQAEGTKNRQLARLLLDEALSLVQDDPNAHVAYARLLWPHQPEEAEMHIHAALAAAPQHFGAVKMHAMLLHQRGRAYEAEAQIASALAAQPRDAQLAELYADLLMQSGRYEEAAACLLTALEGEPSNGKLNARLAVACAKSGRTRDALTRFEIALKTESDTAFLHREYAEVLLTMGRHREAEQHYVRALELDPKDPLAHRGYATLLAALQRHHQAREQIQRALALLPGDAEIAAQAQEIESQTRHFEQVEESIAYAAYLGRQSSATSIRKARQIFEQLERSHRSSFLVLKEYGKFLQAQQHLVAAKEILQRALDSVPEDAEIKQRLAEIAVAESIAPPPPPHTPTPVPSHPVPMERLSLWHRIVRGLSTLLGRST